MWRARVMPEVEDGGGHVRGPAASSACLSDLRFVSGILPLRAARATIHSGPFIGFAL
jgi:hypothetical protein